MGDYHTDNAVFLVYKDWETLFDSLDSSEEAGELIKALFAFAKRGEIAEFSGALKMAFIFMSQQIERDGEKWEAMCEKRAEYGRKGGISKAKKQKLAQASTSYQKLASVADTDTVTDTDTDTVTDNNKRSVRFVPPTVEEVRAYCNERRNGIDPESFVDFYTSKGWMVGSSKMKDWKASVREWERRRKTTAKPAQNFGQSSIDLSEAEKLFNR